MSLTVAITSDFICPWCIIGERRMAQALALLPEETGVTLQWLPFELNPDMPVQGMDRRDYRTMKFGSWERSQQQDARTVQAAQGDGIAFDYEAITRTPNTLAAHRLMRLAQRHGKATPLARAIFSAYFEQGLDIGDTAVLAGLAAMQGLDRDEAAAFLADERSADEVRRAEREALMAGIQGVPHFDIGGHAISGAQPVAVFVSALRSALAHQPSPAG